MHGATCMVGCAGHAPGLRGVHGLCQDHDLGQQADVVDQEAGLQEDGHGLRALQVNAVQPDAASRVGVDPCGVIGLVQLVDLQQECAAGGGDAWAQVTLGKLSVKFTVIDAFEKLQGA